MTYFTAYRSNFCWPVRTLRVKGEEGQWEQRTPAKAAGLTAHGWSLDEWISFPAIQCISDTTPPHACRIIHTFRVFLSLIAHPGTGS
jgi:hypothetical protein